MKVAVCAQGKSLDSAVDPRFGRCTHFVVVDTDNPESSAEGFENPAIRAGGGAGIMTAQQLSDQKIDAVLTGNVGPNAMRTLSAGSIEVYTGISGSVRDALDQLKNDELQRVSSATVGSKFGAFRRDR